MWALHFIRNCRLMSQEQEMTANLTKHQLLLQGSEKGNKKKPEIWR